MRVRPEDPPRVRITLAGNGVTGGGHARSPSTCTSYGVVLPGSKPVTVTSA